MTLIRRRVCYGECKAVRVIGESVRLNDYGLIYLNTSCSCPSPEANRKLSTDR